MPERRPRQPGPKSGGVAHPARAIESRGSSSASVPSQRSQAAEIARPLLGLATPVAAEEFLVPQRPVGTEIALRTRRAKGKTKQSTTRRQQSPRGPDGLTVLQSILPSTLLRLSALHSEPTIRDLLSAFRGTRALL